MIISILQYMIYYVLTGAPDDDDLQDDINYDFSLLDDDICLSEIQTPTLPKSQPPKRYNNDTNSNINSNKKNNRYNNYNNNNNISMRIDDINLDSPIEIDDKSDEFDYQIDRDDWDSQLSLPEDEVTLPVH